MNIILFMCKQSSSCVSQIEYQIQHCVLKVLVNFNISNLWKTRSFMSSNVDEHLFEQGGLRAVVWTDTFQTFVVIAGLIAIIAQGSVDLGGFGNIWDIANKGGRIFFLE